MTGERSIDHDTLRDAALDRSPASLGQRRTNSPHEFYRYPARFPPRFAEAAIRYFTNPAELVLDPFVGGGTTAVEAVRLGRQVIASDLNPLATFVTRVKTTSLDEVGRAAVEGWLMEISKDLNMRRPAPNLDKWAEAGYLKGIGRPDTWRLRKLLALALALVPAHHQAAERFCRCVVLRTAQWALDMRSSLPAASEFRSALADNGRAMLTALLRFTASLPPTVDPLILDAGLPGLADMLHGRQIEVTPKLVLTSPPYPGVYVNYHRWKLLGRVEIPAPYWIADRLDGNGLAHYTMSARAEPTLNAYFSRLKTAFSDLARIITPQTVVVQMVGFNTPATQLPRYLAALQEAGFAEILMEGLATEDDGRLWRAVPGRRWWTEVQSRRSIAPHTAREVVLLHRLRDEP
jgi:hypothetical protein